MIARRFGRLGTLALVLGFATQAVGQNSPSFEGLGDLPGGVFASTARAVSEDGATVVGWSESTGGTQAVRWTPGVGLVGLGLPAADDPFSRATAVSANGSVIAGTAANSEGGRAFRWTSGPGYVFLGTFGCFLCDPATTGEGISGDGLTVVGGGLENPFASPRVNAARWPGGGTGISDLGDLPGPAEASVAQDASADGALIVGEGDSSLGPQGFRWTSGGGMAALPGLPGALVTSGALAVSADASTAVGYANASPSTTNQQEPVRWVAPGWAAENLGALPGQSAARGTAYDVSPDGALVVGTTRNAAGRDVAFLWDATNGMRALEDLLEEAYGLDLGGWELHFAYGISAVDGAGEFTVVGAGVNPAGEDEGFVAFLSPTACNDGLDNDGDTDADFPADPECTAPGDRSEGPDCDDGLDNDGDGLSDLADPGCTGASDLSELLDCGNGIDDDGDGLADFPLDPGCRTAGSPHEAPACDDGLDNDGDLAVDGADAQCLDASDTSERDDCDDGLDNDGDGLFDLADPDCTDAADPSEDPACFDFVDNDGDGRTDYPLAYPRCRSTSDAREAPECSDGSDDDGDGDADYPADAECTGPLFAVESPGTLAADELLVVDAAGGTLRAVDAGTGADRILSEGARLGAPGGVAVRPDGRVVVTDPVGALEVDPVTGLQSARSDPLVSPEGLPVTADSAGDLIVLEEAAISRVAWSPSGIGAKTPLLTLPVGATQDLAFFVGYSLALEDDDTAYTTGFGLLGDGVFRADLAAGSVSKVTPGFSTHVWRDLAVEAPGTLLAVGTHFTLGQGVFRIDTATGAVDPLSTDPAWVQPDGIAVGPGADVYVVDSGTCDALDQCTGGLVAHVDPVSGTRSVLASGLFAGRLGIAVASAPPPACDDGIDDDGDGLVDFPDDPGCTGAADPGEDDPALPCDDGLDDDGDGLADFPADPGCQDPTWAFEDPECDDGVDNDGDGTVDWDGGPGAGSPDPQCIDKPWKNREKKKSRCGLGFELGVLVPALRWLRRRRA